MLWGRLSEFVTLEVHSMTHFVSQVDVQHFAECYWGVFLLPQQLRPYLLDEDAENTARRAF